MIVNVPTKVVPVWFIERWTNENAESGSALEKWVKEMLKAWEQKEINDTAITYPSYPSWIYTNDSATIDSNKVTL